MGFNFGGFDIGLPFDTGIGGILDNIADFGSKLIFGDPSNPTATMQTGGGSQAGGSRGLLGSIVDNPLPFLQTGLLTVGALQGGGEDTPYGQSKEYLDKKLALEAEIAKLQAGAGGAGASAAIEAARIAARSAAIQMREKLLADALAKRLEVKRGDPELMQQAADRYGQAAFQRGQAGQQGFNAAANLIAGARR